MMCSVRTALVSVGEPFILVVTAINGSQQSVHVEALTQLTQHLKKDDGNANAWIENVRGWQIGPTEYEGEMMRLVAGANHIVRRLDKVAVKSVVPITVLCLRSAAAWCI